MASRKSAVAVGLLFILTMFFGMADAYFVVPKMNAQLSDLQQIEGTILLGVFAVFFMAIGIVGIATVLFPIVRRQSEAIAITYVSFRIIECVLLTLGAILYLFLLSAGTMNPGLSSLAGNLDSELPRIAMEVKLNAYQLGMIVLGIGSTLLCYSFYQSREIPRWLSVWGLLGYILLFLSAVFDLLGIVDTINGMGALMYVPGGLWELFAFPIWLLVKGFRTSPDQV